MQNEFTGQSCYSTSELIFWQFFFLNGKKPRYLDHLDISPLRFVPRLWLLWSLAEVTPDWSQPAMIDIALYPAFYVKGKQTW